MARKMKLACETRHPLLWHVQDAVNMNLTYCIPADASAQAEYDAAVQHSTCTMLLKKRRSLPGLATLQVAI